MELEERKLQQKNILQTNNNKYYINNKYYKKLINVFKC